MSVIDTITNFCTSLCLPVVRDIPAVEKKINAKPETPVVEQKTPYLSEGFPDFLALYESTLEEDIEYLTSKGLKRLDAEEYVLTIKQIREQLGRRTQSESAAIPNHVPEIMEGVSLEKRAQSEGAVAPYKPVEGMVATNEELELQMKLNTVKAIVHQKVVESSQKVEGGEGNEKRRDSAVTMGESSRKESLTLRERKESVGKKEEEKMVEIAL